MKNDEATVISVRISKGLKERLESHCQETGNKLPEIVRELLEFYLAMGETE